MKKKLLVGLAAAALAVVPMTAASADNHDTAEVVVVHGVPGLTVDVLVDGDAAIEGFNFGDVAVTELPEGSYDLAIVPTGGSVDDAVLEATADLDAGASYTAAAYLDADGEPTIGLFVNQNDATGIQPFHLAAFGPVSIIAGGDIVLDDVANGATARIDAEGTVPGVGIGVAGSDEAAIELGDVDVPEDTLILAFAIGPDEGEELPQVVVQAIDVADHTPEDVPSGTAGLATNGLPAAVLALMLLGAVALTAPAVAAVRRRS